MAITVVFFSMSHLNASDCIDTSELQNNAQSIALSLLNGENIPLESIENAFNSIPKNYQPQNLIEGDLNQQVEGYKQIFENYLQYNKSKKILVKNFQNVINQFFLKAQEKQHPEYGLIILEHIANDMIG